MKRSLLVRSVGLFPLVLVACGGGGGGAPLVISTFDVPRNAPTNGATPRGLVVADVDRDGYADALLADSALDSVIVMRGAADGSLQPGTMRPTVAQVAAVAVADLDGDRLLDLVTASGTSAEFAVARGAGDGTFGASANGALPWPARQILLADVTGDGVVDLVATSSTATEFAWLAGQGAGSFAAPVVVDLGYLPANIVAADVDRDGRTDLVTVGVGGVQIDAWRNGGSTGLLPAVTTVVGAQLGVLAAADFDDDGNVDLALVSVAGQLVCWRGTGGGSFVAGATVALTTGPVDGLATGDFDGDGWLDCGAAAGAELVVVFGAGATWRTVERVVAGGGAVRSIAAHDLAGDGRWNLLGVAGSTQVAVLTSRLAPPAGLEIYGAGTGDCRGRIGMWANGSPTLGNRDFAYTVTNAPPNTFGLLLQGGPADVPGSDPFALGFTLHIGLGLVTNELVFSDGLGRALLPRPLPGDAGLVGLPVYVQTLWQGAAVGSCSPSPAGISSSIGLVSTVQP